ncbi:pantetheine-phosphate adenylyltransferase [Lactobacillus amylolyticus]|uniref:Phosphopantetheine adenylyltransferase n=1 Tax=Lactobacillus amylolyticus DSM 11664 TaxID=585524 RepID=D4YS14_9LACO|nr:pantetheine-phosphate adenylyltransferase [Lactobacillus amylolyticus]ARD06837.1 pantetheine-phosphate adenylyltransferase [Lactobacillus amylolyticus]EFG56108.1 pantetheine-phosphate adenylyltransferase [Lactobacillus amylolyticus DSM 11664]KRL19196.1 pantetheine-phosphate adenylyltransferase [Lactobacillus amylolyticus DSM 11664]QFY04635.1 pantetheine-phosphate adenylyltransferase [Lactobacillus amylolyticus]TDG60999.1 hypothetical protein C5L18_000974 [Lactobacillus amylolyticus]
MTIALFPGSFDPITNGHLDVAKKAATMFDKVYVVIMTNTNKHYLFNSQERTQMAQETLKDIPNIEVLAKPDQLTVDVARHLKASAIIRGVRNTEDFLYEQQIAGINERLNDQVHTVLLFTDPENSFVASSMIKEVARFNGDIEQFLPANVADALKKKLR